MIIVVVVAVIILIIFNLKFLIYSKIFRNPSNNTDDFPIRQ
jgi:uncharacterized phage infection (PIP) family protein YhgE